MSAHTSSSSNMNQPKRKKGNWTQRRAKPDLHANVWGVPQDHSGWGLPAAEVGAGWGFSPAIHTSGWEPQTAGALSGWDLPPDLAAWGVAEETKLPVALALDLAPAKSARRMRNDTPFDDMRTCEWRSSLDLKAPAKVKFRVRQWMKICVLAEGGTWTDCKDDEEPVEIPHWEAEPIHNWAATVASAQSNEVEQSRQSQSQQDVQALRDDAGSVEASDARADDIAWPAHQNDPFVERIAHMHGWDPKTTRNRNEFYTLPTQQKVKHINEMIRFLSSTQS